MADEQPIPYSRAYRHVECGEETLVSGDTFELVSNPMSSMEQSLCSNCGTMCPISDLVWADTGETIADYYARHTANATETQRLLCSKKFMVALWLLGAISSAIASFLLVKNDDVLTQVICTLGGAMIGVIVASVIFISCFANPIKRSVCGVKSTRQLT